MKNRKEEGPLAAAASTDAAGGRSNTKAAQSQLEKVLEKFTKTKIPDLWFYGNDLQKKTDKWWQQPRLPYNPEFGEEILDFWRLAHDLQRALLERAGEGGGHD
jgi:hypothetical protein